MDGVELELACLCGCENFERVIVRRLPNEPFVTDFVACVGCRAVYYSPLPKPEPREHRVGHGMMGIGGPERLPESRNALKRDEAEAAKDYAKPGRSKGNQL